MWTAFPPGPTPAPITAASVTQPELPPRPPVDFDGFNDSLLLGLVVVIGVAVVLTFVYGLFRRRRQQHARRQQLGSRPRELELTTLTGVVRAIEQPLISPLAGTACVGYRAHARVVSGLGVVLGEATEVELTRFALETTAGVVVVEAVADTSDLRLPPIRIPMVSEARGIAFLARNRHRRELLADTVFDEIAIEVGARIAVCGMVTSELDPASPQERGYRDDAPRRMLMVAHAEPLRISDPKW